MEGQTLGSYKILERLGAGGQGHVYRAVDTTLDREIAVKILPAALVNDPDRLKQFRQEAKLLAVASHANIATVYAIEEHEGVHFFTQEFVPGRTLAEMIEDGPFDVTDTLEIGRQVASALEMAHERGLVHRDLKPANVMVRQDGAVKVLDFGLALPVNNEEGAEDLGISDSTPTASHTTSDVIVGTAPYMSPDQARGRAVDHRTDIWAFGCILFECLTGGRPFEGDTLLDTLSAIVRVEPDWELLPPATPRRLRNLVQRCLRKRTADRLQHIGDARVIIEEMLADPGEAERADAAPAAPAASGSGWGRLAFAAVLGLLLGALGWAAVRPAPEPATPLRAVLTLAPVQMNLEASPALDWSPATRQVAYAGVSEGSTQVYTSSFDAFLPQPIDGTQGGENPFFSPDGDWIGFFSADFELAKVSAMGGAVVPICEVPVGNWGAVWLPDDTIVYATYSTGLGLMRVSADGGTPEPVTTLDLEAGETNHGWPRLLPDGRLLFTITTATGTSVALLDLESGEQRTLVDGAVDAQFLHPNHLLFGRGGTIFAQPFDPATATLSGTARPVVQDMFTHSRGARTSYAVGHDGTLVYAPGRQGPARDRFVWVDRQGNAEALSVPPGSYGHPRLSPDNQFITYDAADEGRGDIWVYDLARGTPTRITDSGDNVMPVWSSNGRQVMFASSGRGGAGLYWHRADGSGDAHLVKQSDNSLWPLAWHGEAIAYYELDPETGRDIYVDTGGESIAFQASRFNERSPVFSPDGRWIAYVSNESGRDEIYVKELGGESAQYTISQGGGAEPHWSPMGNELFYRSGNRMMAVSVELPGLSGGAFRVGETTALFEGVFKQESFAGNQYYDVSADGQRFLMIREDSSLRGPDRLHVVTHFDQEIAAPTDG